MYPLLHVVTYMTCIDYNALLTPLIAKASVVQWIECRTPDSGAESSNHGVGRYFFLFIKKFTEYKEVYRICSDFYLYSRYVLVYVLVVSSQVNACISKFDLLLSTYSK